MHEGAAVLDDGFLAGGLVELRDLKRNELNGLRGFCLGQTEAQRGDGRVGVRVNGRRDLSVRVCNLVSVLKLGGVEEKGFGVIANVHIGVGTLIVRERPVICSGVDKPAVSDQFASLPREEQTAVLALHDAYESSQGSKSVRGIMLSNATPRSPTGNSDEAVLGLLTSRFNHSCTPNAEFLWREGSGVEEVVAIRDIAAGEELCTNYIGDGILQPCDARRHVIHSSFHFNCLCYTCVFGGKASDARRTEISKIRDSVVNYEKQPEEGLRLVDCLLELFNEERISTPRVVAQTFNDGFQLALLAGDASAVQFWARRSYQAHQQGWGDDDPMTKQMKDYAEHPPMLSMAGGGDKTEKEGDKAALFLSELD